MPAWPQATGHTNQGGPDLTGPGTVLRPLTPGALTAPKLAGDGRDANRFEAAPP